MLIKTGIKIIILITLAMFVCVGCAAKTETKVASADKARNVFGESEGNKNSKQSTGIGALTKEDEKLLIPGYKFGKAPKIRKSTKKNKVIPYSEGIADQMEGLMWGMSIRKVLSQFEFRIHEKYKGELKESTGDALAEDRIRTQMIRELNKLAKSYVEFTGQTTGYESHLISKEFTHNNGESMIVWDSETCVEYLFFFNGRFWKRVRSFRVDKLGGISFLDFTASVESKLEIAGKEYVNSKNELEKIMWRDEETYASVVDRSSFFGAYGFIFTSAISETYLDELRPSKGKKTGAVEDELSNMVNDVTSATTDFTDHRESVIDGYTGGGNSADYDNSNSVKGKKKKDKKKDKKKGKKKSKDGESNEPSQGDQSDIDDIF